MIKKLKSLFKKWTRKKRIFYKNEEGKLNRIDGPAYFYEYLKEYNRHGCWHRENGTQWYSYDGNKIWWINDKLIKGYSPKQQKIYG